ncbi:transglycosylase domain-containing protein [Patescibacteria group bacterium]|nr:transglycosylase domain-containing protein [Patescibacteria group bacterium]
MAKRKYHRQIFQENKKRRWFFFAVKLLGFLFFISLFTGFALFVFYAKDLPRPEGFTERDFVESTKIYDRTGEILLYEIYGEEKRKVVPLEVVPEYLKQGVMLAEDSNFYNHFGIDFKGIFRAALVNLRLGKPIQGGSTISQQLVRSSMLTRKKTLERKIREVILTLELERRYSKDQILEWYLNQVPFGSNAYGVEAASQTFFQKSVSEISIGEAAVLATLIQAPSYLSPYGENKSQLLDRMNLILDKMVGAGILTKEEKNQIKEDGIDFAEILQPIKAPHFVFYITEYLLSKYGEEFLKEKGLRVYTSLNWEFQKLAEKVVQKGAENNINYRAFNASLVAIAPQTGEILAMVGSKDFFGENFPEDCISGKNCLFEPQFNVALGSKRSPGRQPGSAFKPFVYATAFKKGYNDETVVVDKETDFGIWGGKRYIPQNYDGIFRGPVTLRTALAQSLNIPSVKVLVELAGIEDSIETAKELGITTLNMPTSFYGPSLVLGGGEVKLLDMVSGYGVFAAGGMKIPPVSILKITDSGGNIIEENKKTQKRVLEIKIADLITDILSDNTARSPMFGNNSLMYFKNFQVAAKTGTTGDFRDGWIIGYTSLIAVGVWVGNNDNSPMFKQPGIMTAGPIWRAFIEKVLFEL